MTIKEKLPKGDSTSVRYWEEGGFWSWEHLSRGNAISKDSKAGTQDIFWEWPVDSFDKTCQRSCVLKRHVEVRLWIILNAMKNRFMF